MLYATLTGTYLAIDDGFFVVSLLMNGGSIRGLRSDNALTVFALSTVAWQLVVYWVIRSRLIKCEGCVDLGWCKSRRSS